MNNKELQGFKDGVADAILEGTRAEYHSERYYYKQGYDFGITLYCDLKKLDEEEKA
tara:strand:+ start:677 stop:844 length:168 start_codon:yes stop_codon:yes gene_type:complete